MNQTKKEILTDKRYLNNIDYDKILDDSLKQAMVQKDGYRFGLSAFNIQFGGIYPNDYFIWTGKSGTGKSTIVYDQILFQLIDSLTRDVIGMIKMKNMTPQEFIELYKKNSNKISELKKDIAVFIKSSLYIRFFSLEISIAVIMHKMLVRYIYKLPKDLEQHGLLTTRFTTGRIIPKEKKEELLNKVLAVKNTAFFQISLLILKSIVYIEEDISNTKNILQIIKDDETTVKALESHYNIKNELLYLMFFDHIALSTGDEEYVNIGVISKEALSLRKRNNASCHIIQQTNPDKESKKNFAFIVPTYEDLRGNKSTFQDADVVVSLASPANEGYDTIQYGNGVYRINPFAPQNEALGLLNNLIVGKIVKDRNGNPNTNIAMGFIGAVGIMEDIPTPDSFKNPNDEISFYEKYMDLQLSFENKDSIYYMR